jgi:hypothetical protein
MMNSDVFANGYFIGLIIGVCAVAAVWWWMRDAPRIEDDEPSTINEERKE